MGTLTLHRGGVVDQIELNIAEALGRPPPAPPRYLLVRVQARRKVQTDDGHEIEVDDRQVLSNELRVPLQ
ncbi:MAG: hypothetical protein FJX74_08845 [Armatimonadetes bacterium]|nr:hypothetical protein [Armatimonadota bacterium]